jgi:hypothetical protein
MKLYEISEQYDSALNALLYAEDMPEDAIQDTLEALEGELMEKGKAVAAYTLNLAAEIDMIDAHIKAMQAKVKVLKSRDQWLRHYLKTNMLRVGITEIKANDGTFTAKIGKGRESIVIDDESLLPECCFEVKREASKTKIKMYMEDGLILDGAAHIERNPTLTIK